MKKGKKNNVDTKRRKSKASKPVKRAVGKSGRNKSRSALRAPARGKRRPARSKVVRRRKKVASKPRPYAESQIGMCPENAGITMLWSRTPIDSSNRQAIKQAVAENLGEVTETKVGRFTFFIKKGYESEHEKTIHDIRLFVEEYGEETTAVHVL
jgi:hypothetical protein